MRKIFGYYVFTALLLFICILCTAQQAPFKGTALFEAGQFTISKTAVNTLREVADSIRKKTTLRVQLEGNTDTIGGLNYNRRLSEKRALAVKAFFVASGVTDSVISVKAWGAKNPVASNQTSIGRASNRRVDIFIFNAAGRAESRAPLQNIALVYQQLEPPAEEFCINPSRDTILRCRQGTVIYIKDNALLPSSSCSEACIKFRVREAFLKSDMILNNLSTTSNGEIIETQGMIYTEAFDCQGNQLKLEKEKDLVIVVPTEKINPSAKIFDGKRMHDSIMNWTVNNNSRLRNFSLSDLDICGGWLCAPPRIIDCGRCTFFFCRIGRIGKATRGLFSKAQRMENKKFNDCQKELAVINSPSTEIISSNPTLVRTRPVLDAAIIPRCQELEALFKSYGVKNTEELILAINKPLLDSFKVSTIAALQDTLTKITRQKIELSYMKNKVSFNDFKYYIYNSPRLGWSNVDVFANIDRSLLITLKVNLPADENVDCKLVFKDRQFIIPATKADAKFHFNAVPKGEKAVIVAIKYENGKPLLALKDVIVGNKTFEVEFKQLTLDELKEQLKQLD